MKKYLALAGAMALLPALILGTVRHWWESPGSHPGQQPLVITAGSSLATVAEQLHRAGLLQYPRLWRALVRLRGLDGQIKQGEYIIDGSLSPARILTALIEGRVRQYSVTLPEGITLRQALQILWQQEPLRRVLRSAEDASLLALAVPHQRAEGLFFPDTYLYVYGDTDLQLLTQANRRMLEELDASWQQRSLGLPYAGPYEALIMASIVEKETGLASERQTIAGVFVRRLQKRMKLQTDPTVIYGLGSAFDGDLLRRHLADAANAYNTYQHRGLPPTPIALPGKAAIEAALHPAHGSALFFVARGDGSHKFSDTLREHKAAVRHYQLQRRADYRSQPRPGQG